MRWASNKHGMAPATIAMSTQLPEFALITRWARHLTYDRTVHVGVGDDAAVLCGGRHWRLLVTTDMLVDGVHFISNRARPELIGRKALAVSLSDIAAMGGTPWAAVIAVGVPRHCPRRMLDRVHRGIRRLARQFRVQLVGGDLVRASQLTITVTLCGWAAPRRVILRSGARAGDELWVTGRLGRSLASGRHMTFTPRVHVARRLVQRYRPTAMMDLSDGLASDVRQLASASRVGCRIHAARIPCARHATVTHALCDGEDFELLFTLRPRMGRQLARQQSLGVRATHIGTMTQQRDGLRLVTPTRSWPLPLPTFRHR